MRIISWNVNGLRAILSRNALDWAWAREPDVLCLQEIKARPDQLSEEQRTFPGYEPIWNPAERPGYSGVATFLRSPVPESQCGMGAAHFDLEGRVIQTCHPGFRLFNIYFPNGGRGQDRVLYKLDFYAHLLNLCDALHARGESIIITGISTQPTSQSTCGMRNKTRRSQALCPRNASGCSGSWITALWTYSVIFILKPCSTRGGPIAWTLANGA